jgi:AraC family transcriptional regulator
MLRKTEAMRPRGSTLCWPGLRSEYAVLPAAGGGTVTKPFQVGVAFSGHRRTVRAVDGHVVRADAPPGAVYVTGPAPIQWLDVPDPTEALEMYPDPSLVSQLVGGPLDIPPALAVTDGAVFALAGLLRRVHLGTAGLTDIEVSTLTHRLVHHLTRRYGSVRPHPHPPGQLRHGATDAVAAHIHGHLAGPITLNSLAGTVGLSSYHFARSFKATTGMTPHAFTTAHRMTVAKDRLLRTAATVADVAYAVGYVNVAHFRREFRREFGVTPATLRAALVTR